MSWPGTRIRIRVKLFTGLHREVGLKDYDPEAGIEMDIRKGARIRTLAKRLGLAGGGPVAFMKPSAGG